MAQMLKANDTQRREAGYHVLEGLIQYGGEAWVAANRDRVYTLLHVSLGEAACEHGPIQNAEDVIREAGLKFAAIEMLWVLVSNYDVDKSITSSFVMNALKFLFDSSTDSGKNIQNVIYKHENKRQKQCKVLIMRILYKLNCPNLY